MNEAIKAQSEAIDECARRIVTIEGAIEQIVLTLQDLAKATNDTQQVLIRGQINYKPSDGETHLNMKENFDQLYDRIIKLEHGM
ncbi:hypothetical protein SShM2_086 [Synechococcus phage S-ShM2]|uniref:Uncharacterized protein n=1 Tax=Synechococcus phage S-ShM2 TaxID=445683 RepID=E3SJY7_9CAUD|nr:hypothetical protein SShM2_086 [Synechococcus phage S-ShM2]ADO97697.1 hypothetical protein SShM2_086 [Synechococcus phage S-ShM2]